jgi:hypothetical protein
VVGVLLIQETPVPEPAQQHTQPAEERRPVNSPPELGVPATLPNRADITTPMSQPVIPQIQPASAPVTDNGLNHLNTTIGYLATQEARLKFRPQTNIDELKDKQGLVLDSSQRAALHMLVDVLDDRIADGMQVLEIEKMASIKHLVELGVFENIPTGPVDYESARSNNPDAMIAVIPGPTSQTNRLVILTKHNSPLVFAAKEAVGELRARKTVELQAFFNRIREGK